jgi:hypothetical protein
MDLTVHAAQHGWLRKLARNVSVESPLALVTGHHSDLIPHDPVYPWGKPEDFIMVQVFAPRILRCFKICFRTQGRETEDNDLLYFLQSPDQLPSRLYFCLVS